MSSQFLEYLQKRYHELNSINGKYYRQFYYSEIVPKKLPKKYSDRNSAQARIVRTHRSKARMQEFAQEISKLSQSGSVVEYVNKQDETGMTPLHTAVYFQCNDICNLLISVDADINATNNFGYSALFMAYGANQDTNMGKWLLENGADPNIKAKMDNGKQWTLFHLLTILNRRDFLKLLVKFGGNPSEPLEDGTVPMIYALDEDTRMFIAKLSRKYNRAVDRFDALCAWCGKHDCTLRRCSGCYATYYCNKDCQNFDWKYAHSKTCVKPMIVGGTLEKKIEDGAFLNVQKTDEFYIAGMNKEMQDDVWNRNKIQMHINVGKFFVVAVEFVAKHRNLLFYNEDRSIHSWMGEFEAEYDNLIKLLDTDTCIHLWATVHDHSKGSLAIFPAQKAPKQSW